MREQSISVPIIYTIVHTSAYADHGSFPPPNAIGSFLSSDLAHKELVDLVESEKESMEVPFSAEQYREESGDNFWEAYQDGYAAGWFTRFEVISSQLRDGESLEGCK